MRHIITILTLALCMAHATAAEPFVTFHSGAGMESLSDKTGSITYDANDWKGVVIAIGNLKEDLTKVSGRCDYPICVGTLGKSKVIDKLAKKKVIDASQLKGKTEKYIITMANGQLIIAGSDKRGTIYGIYELSQQIGVSPWYDWADVPMDKHDSIYIKKGVYTDGEPAVRYRGIFINDEAPCLSGWIAENYGGVYNSKFYARVFELVLRLKGNYMWPAMWNAAFYADDPANMQTADDMGVIMGTSHHEPMARAHKEWTRDKSHGAWNYDTNKDELDSFWKSGVERMKHTEDVVTIGMRGNGDEPMGKNADVDLLEKVVKNQRRLIEEATGKPAEKTPQLWALYKEVQEYYEKGMTVPDDVILLLCDDNWGNVRVLPELDGNNSTGAFSKRHPGGYGLYYHVDYVGGPRSTKFLNVSQVQRMWEQLQLTYDYGVDRLWILNVGDIKPMEMPIDFWFKMAWDPSKFSASNLMDYTRDFCAQQFGQACANKAAELLNLQCKYAHRRTPELLDAKTFDLMSGEWKERVDTYNKLEREATILRESIPVNRRDAYNQIIYFPVRVMANLYNMYYAQALNLHYAAQGNARANEWADKVELCFRRDKELCDEYNHKMAKGKWNHMMDEVHIGYRSWDGPRHNICPEVKRVENVSADNATSSKASSANGSSSDEIAFTPKRAIIIEASDYVKKQNAAKATWQTIPYFGACRDGVALLPYTASTEGAWLTYSFCVDKDMENSSITIVLAPTFPFNSGRGQRMTISLDGSPLQTINVNEASKYITNGFHDQNYDWEITRMNCQKLSAGSMSKGEHTLTFTPLDPGMVIEQVIIE